jgi:Zn-finger nucleic acid-binding protein
VADHAAMACPVCRTSLVMSERQGIEMDYCPACRGVWLDRGELDKIIERSSSAGPAAGLGVPPMREARHHDHGERRYHGKRRKSFLEELFD